MDQSQWKQPSEVVSDKKMVSRFCHPTSIAITHLLSRQLWKFFILKIPHLFRTCRVVCVVCVSAQRTSARSKSCDSNLKLWFSWRGLFFQSNHHIWTMLPWHSHPKQIYGTISYKTIPKFVCFYFIKRHWQANPIGSNRWNQAQKNEKKLLCHRGLGWKQRFALKPIWHKS